MAEQDKEVLPELWQIHSLAKPQDTHFYCIYVLTAETLWRARHLHTIPELSYDLPETSAYVRCDAHGNGVSSDMHLDTPLSLQNLRGHADAKQLDWPCAAIWGPVKQGCRCRTSKAEAAGAGRFLTNCKFPSSTPWRRRGLWQRWARESLSLHCAATWTRCLYWCAGPWLKQYVHQRAFFWCVCEHARAS